MKLYLLSAFVILFLLACERAPNSISFPDQEHEFPEPKTLSIHLPRAVTTTWAASPKGTPRARTLKTYTEPFKNPTFDVDPAHPLLVPLDSELVEFEKLASVPLNLTALPSKKIKPEIVLLGIPKKVKAEIPVVEDQFVNGLLEIGQDQGLPGTSVRSLLQDKDGRLWLATDNGLCVFNGESIDTYLKRTGISRDQKSSLCMDKNGHIWAAGMGIDEIIPEEGIVRHFGKSQGLCSNAISSIFIGRDDKVYFTGLEGVDIYDPAGESLVHIGTREGLSINYINRMEQDQEGRLWFASNCGGVNIYDPQKQKMYSLRAKQGLSNDDIRAIICDKDGNMWLGGWNGGVDKYDAKTGKFFHLRMKHGLAFSYIHSLIEDHEGKIWIGCQESGTDVYDPVKRTIEHVYGQAGIAKSSVYCLLEDRAHCIWMGSSSAGVVKYDPSNGRIRNYSNKFWAARRPIMGLYKDREKNTWISTAGEGLDIFDHATGTLRHMFTGGDWTDAWQNTIVDDGYGHLYMGTEYRFNIFEKKNGSLVSWGLDDGLINSGVMSVMPIGGGVILGTRGGIDRFDTLTSTFTHLDAKEDPCKSQVECMTQDAKGRIWIGTEGNALFMYDPKAAVLRHFAKEQGFSNNPIYCILTDSAGCVWVGTGSDGLKKLDTEKKLVTRIGTENGLSEMTVLSLIEKDHRIYAGTVKGLSVIGMHGQQIAIKNLGKPQGLRTYDFNTSAAIISDQGSLWWGIGDMLTIFDPANQPPAPGTTAMTAIDLMGKELDFNVRENFKPWLGDADTVWSAARDTFYFKRNIRADTGYLQAHQIHWKGTNDAYYIPQDLVLPYNQDRITFHFTGNYLSNTDKTRYRYILEGIDRQWNTITNNAFADYRNLPPGQYVFKVCSNNFDGPWSSPRAFAFKITPPWWKTNIAYACYILFFIGISFGYNRIHTSRLRGRQKALEQKVDERTREIVEKKNEIEIQKHTVEEKQKEIVDSINYARRIQYTLLADDKLLKKNFRDYFVLFQPKDIVSGDFYWATFVKASDTNGPHDYFYLAVCDSTGHGVPGAFMSILNISFMNEAINEKHIFAPDEIFNYVRERLVKSISREGGQDGMDGILLRIASDPASGNIISISYAAGNNSPKLYSNGALTDLPVNKMPIGKGEKNQDFTLYTIDAKKGDIVYLYTDGFADQFGGPNGKKFKYKKLNELLCTYATEPMEKQKDMLLSVLNDWKGELEQVDDICLLGIKM